MYTVLHEKKRWAFALDILKERLWLLALFDRYGVLLKEANARMFRAYYEEDLSLTEIAESFGLTKQGVSDSLKRSKEQLQHYEEMMRLLQKEKEVQHILGEIRKDQKDKWLLAKLDELEQLL